MAKDKNGNRGCCGCACGCVSGLFGLIALVAILCGGTFFYLRSNAPKPPIPDFTPNAAAAQQLENTLSNASASASQTGHFNMVISELQASSWLNLSAPFVSEEDVPLENLQVRFRDGEVVLYSEAQTPLGRIGTEVGVEMRVGTDGKLDVQVGTIDLGGVNMPQSVSDELSTAIENLMDEQLREVSSSAPYRITFISSSDGVLQISGTVGT